MKRFGLLFFFVPLAAFAADAPRLLAEKCQGCHNEKLKTGGLSLTTRDAALQGGGRGPALTAGDPDASLLIKAVRQQDELKMPPGGKLADAEIALLETWIRDGAEWSPSETEPATDASKHWSFLQPKRPAAPQVSKPDWTHNPVDSFVLARLEKEGIAPSPETDKRTLIRRAYLDVTGLPPNPDQVEAFVNDTRPEAWEEVVERLLASKHYGERWGQRWLDQARYADSDGGSRDEPRQIWRYRDWVIESLNRDQPFDEFVVEQLAGDLLPNPRTDQIVATGFNRNTLLQIEAGTDREQYRVEMIYDRVDTMGTVFLGLSVGCARCHNHKFDPIAQKEYFQLYSFFNSTDDWDDSRPRFQQGKLNNLHVVHAPLLEFGTDEEIARRDAIRAQVDALEDELAKYRKEAKPKADDAGLAERNRLIDQLVAAMPEIDATLVMRELEKPRETFIHQSGNFLSPGDRVQPGVLKALHTFEGREEPNRLDLARWLVSRDNPLLARVTVNRIWQEYFGLGIVETENDFGTQGSPPTHPELLDWLATELMDNGWSRKRIHRLILTSAVYRQSSDARPELAEKDPRNRLLARQNRLRLDAEIVRDVSLSVSGMLTPVIGGAGVYPPQPETAMLASQIKKEWDPSEGEDRYRRGMYTFFWRLTPHPALMVFDRPDSNFACTRRPRSNTPLQALTLLNDAAFHELYQAFARRMLDEPAGERIERAFELTVCREPGSKEAELISGLLAQEKDALQTTPKEARLLAPDAGENAVDLAAWTAVARVLMNTDEFITRE
jgi:hypothetical protein